MPRLICDEAISCLKDLIAFPSVSSTSNEAITQRVRSVVEALGFQTELTSYADDRGVPKFNLIAKRSASQPASDKDQASTPNASSVDGPHGLAYFCHTDVVPVSHWTGPADAFTAIVEDDRLYGRGSCDMKGSLAVMLAAVKRIKVTEQSAPIWITATADEEVGFAGARHLVQQSELYREMVADQPVAIIGEPTMLAPYHAHKGIRGFRLTSHGKAGHSSTRHGVNANIAMVPMLDKLLEIEQRTRQDSRYHDQRFDPPHLSWNFGFSDHMTAVNITPPTSHAWCSFRTMPAIDGEDLVDEVRELAAIQGVDFQRLEGSPPMWVEADSHFLKELQQLTGVSAETVCYATDGGVMTDLNHRVVLGPGDIAQAHTSDEFISLEQIDRGIDLYTRVLKRWT